MLKFVGTSLCKLLIKFLLKSDFTICTHITDHIYVFDHFVHFNLVFLIGLPLLIQLLLQNLDLALELADRQVVLVTLRAFLEQGCRELADFLIVCLIFKSSLLQLQFDLVKLGIQVLVATVI